MIAASQVRVACVALPPIPAARVAAAARFALEDRVAGPPESHWLAASAQRPDGRVAVVIVARALVAGLRSRIADLGVALPLTRALAEPELASAGAGACWCIPAEHDAGGGFVRFADGSAFPVDAIPPDGALPPELRLALANAARDGAAPAQVRVDAAVADAALARWRQETGVPFVRGTPWQWHAAGADAFALATNLLQGEMAPIPAPRARRACALVHACTVDRRGGTGAARDGHARGLGMVADRRLACGAGLDGGRDGRRRSRRRSVDAGRRAHGARDALRRVAACAGLAGARTMHCRCSHARRRHWRRCLPASSRPRPTPTATGRSICNARIRP